MPHIWGILRRLATDSYGQCITWLSAKDQIREFWNASCEFVSQISEGNGSPFRRNLHVETTSALPGIPNPTRSSSTFHTDFEIFTSVGPQPYNIGRLGDLAQVGPWQRSLPQIDILSTYSLHC